MKKILISIFFILITLGCSEHKHGFPDLNCKAQSYILRDFEAYYEGDEITYNPNEPVSFQENTFDHNGNDTKVFRNEQGEFIDTHINKYNDKNQLIYRKSFFRLFGEENILEYRLAANKDGIICFRYFHNNIEKPEYHHRIVYDTNTRSHYLNDTLLSEESYNKEGQPIRSAIYKEDGSLALTKLYIYEDNLLVEEVSQKGEDESTLTMLTHQYLKFDEKGNWSLRANFENDSLITVTERVVTY